MLAGQATALCTKSEWGLGSCLCSGSLPVSPTPACPPQHVPCPGQLGGWSMSIPCRAGTGASHCSSFLCSGRRRRRRCFSRRWGRAVLVPWGCPEPLLSFWAEPQGPIAQGPAWVGVSGRCEGLEVAGISPSAVFGLKFVLFFFGVNSARTRAGLPAPACAAPLPAPRQRCLGCG